MFTMLAVNIEKLEISNHSKPVLIAEIGINHEGSLNLANGKISCRKWC